MFLGCRLPRWLTGSWRSWLTWLPMRRSKKWARGDPTRATLRFPSDQNDHLETSIDNAQLLAKHYKASAPRETVKKICKLK